MTKDNSAGWWAGRYEYLFNIGPEPTRQGAIDEALLTECFEEVEISPGVWKRRVYYAECGGLHFDCGECGTVPKACDECVDYLDAEDTGGTFGWSRNEGFQDFDYEDSNGQDG